MNKRFSNIDSSFLSLRTELHATISSKIDDVRTELNTKLDKNKSDNNEQNVQLSKANLCLYLFLCHCSRWWSNTRHLAAISVQSTECSGWFMMSKTVSGVAELEYSVRDINRHPLATQQDVHDYFRALEGDIAKLELNKRKQTPSSSVGSPARTMTEKKKQTKTRPMFMLISQSIPVLSVASVGGEKTPLSLNLPSFPTSPDHTTRTLSDMHIRGVTIMGARRSDIKRVRRADP